MKMSRPLLLFLFVLALGLAQFRESGLQAIASHLDLRIDPLMPARVYLFKDDKPFRLSPVQAMMPLRVDGFYRERLWRNSTDPTTLEVTCNDESHFLLLKGRGLYDLPAGKYRVEAYRGFFYAPAVQEFELKAGETTQVALKLENWAGSRRSEWISGDDHIHLTRSREDNDLYLRWLEAEDLSVGNFLQLQRQMDAAVQYGFGAAGEARRGNYMIRPGHESRSEFYGHINLLGGREMLRPLSVGTSLANSPEAYPYPNVLFGRGRKLGATVGYAHFNGANPHSTLMMDLVAGSIDFVEVFQFSVLKTAQWYELLNAGFQVTGIAGSDFPANMGRLKSGARTVPLLGPERTMVKARAGASSPYEVWAAGVRKGQAFVTNGPLIEMAMDAAGQNVTASAEFYRSLEKLEIVVNGEVVSSAGDGSQKRLTASAKLPEGSCWVAARTRATADTKGPLVQAHTNPLYRLRGGKPVSAGGARAKLAALWEGELKYYESAGFVFPGAKEKQEFFDLAERTLAELRK